MKFIVEALQFSQAVLQDSKQIAMIIDKYLPLSIDLLYKIYQTVQHNHSTSFSSTSWISMLTFLSLFISV